MTTLIKQQRNRVVQIEVGAQGERGLLFAVEGRRQETDRSLRLDFDVTYAPDGAPPKGSFTVYNAPKGLAQALRRDGRNFMRISAGYEQPAVIFAGRPVRQGVKVKPRSQNGEWVLHVQALSGGRKYREAVASISIDGQIKYEAFFRQVCSDAGLKIGVLDLAAAPRILPNGVQYEGPTFRVLDQLARMGRGKIVYDGERVSLLRTGVGVPPGYERVRRFASDNRSLIGQPTETDKGLSFRVLLDPGMRVGQQCQLRYVDPIEEQYVTRRVVAHRVRFKGSTHARDFYTDVTGRILREKVKTQRREQTWKGSDTSTRVIGPVSGQAGITVGP